MTTKVKFCYDFAIAAGNDCSQQRYKIPRYLIFVTFDWKWQSKFNRPFYQTSHNIWLHDLTLKLLLRFGLWTKITKTICLIKPNVRRNNQNNQTLIFETRTQFSHIPKMRHLGILYLCSYVAKPIHISGNGKVAYECWVQSSLSSKSRIERLVWS